jgi:hypothetical protein
MESKTILRDLNRIAAAARAIKKIQALKRKADKALASGLIQADRHAALMLDLNRIAANEILIANSHATGIASLFDLSDETSAAGIAHLILS